MELDIGCTARFNHQEPPPCPDSAARDTLPPRRLRISPMMRAIFFNHTETIIRIPLRRALLEAWATVEYIVTQVPREVPSLLLLLASASSPALPTRNTSNQFMNTNTRVTRVALQPVMMRLSAPWTCHASLQDASSRFCADIRTEAGSKRQTLEKVCVSQGLTTCMYLQNETNFFFTQAIGITLTSPVRHKEFFNHAYLEAGHAR